MKAVQRSKSGKVLRRFLKPLVKFLKQGISPHELALTLSLGVVIGLIPLMGVNTFILTVVALVFRLNLPAVQLINYSLFVAQLLLYIPFIRLGELLLGMSPFPLNFGRISNMFTVNWLDALQHLWLAHAAGLFAWFIVGLPAGFLLYYLSKPVFYYYSKPSS